MYPEKTNDYAALPRFAANCGEADGLTLAFLGDAVYELMLRDLVLSSSAGRVELLHRDAVYYANASFQAQAADRILPLLTEEEAGVYKRGRNAHVTHTPKNKTEAEYHKATGFEALLGWLYLKGDAERLQELFLAAVNETAPAEALPAEKPRRKSIIRRKTL